MNKTIKLSLLSLSTLFLIACDTPTETQLAIELHHLSMQPGCFVSPPEGWDTITTINANDPDAIFTAAPGAFQSLQKFILRVQLERYKFMNAVIKQGPRLEEWSVDTETDVAETISGLSAAQGRGIGSSTQSSSVARAVGPPELIGATGSLSAPRLKSDHSINVDLWRLESTEDETTIAYNWDPTSCTETLNGSTTCMNEEEYGYIQRTKTNTVLMFGDTKFEGNEHYFHAKQNLPYLRGCDPSNKISFGSTLDLYLEVNGIPRPYNEPTLISQDYKHRFIIRCWNQDREIVSCDGVDFNPGL